MGPLNLLAVGLPTGSDGSLEYLAIWAKDTLRKLNELPNIQASVIIHFGDFFCGNNSILLYYNNSILFRRNRQ